MHAIKYSNVKHYTKLRKKVAKYEVAPAYIVIDSLADKLNHDLVVWIKGQYLLELDEYEWEELVGEYEDAELLTVVKEHLNLEDADEEEALISLILNLT